MTADRALAWLVCEEPAIALLAGGDLLGEDIGDREAVIGVVAPARSRPEPGRARRVDPQRAERDAHAQRAARARRGYGADSCSHS